MPLSKQNKRLVVCLDGSWNKRDDSTNVLHLYQLVQQGPVDEKWKQLKYYDEGVGTGVLDNISGGAFGIGLETNVREAVTWLVENYDTGDEIYIFGFSRGAFTARSLVGFIAKCGLPRRGAPLTVNQLWEGYGILGRHKEMPLNWWEKLVGRLPQPFRQINDFQEDEWRKELPDGDWRKSYKGISVSKEDLNETEKLIDKWCRRPPITCLGIFDTVGAMGAEALAVPGLRSELAMTHNMRLHSIVGSAFHAIALDENRMTFSLTPLREYVPAERASRDPGRAIKQQWFVGAHSNIGGGYPDNTLSMLPLSWMMERCGDLGLKFSEFPDSLPVRGEPTASAIRSLRDSFEEFARPWWTHVIRGKRNYRHIAPEPEHFGPSAGSLENYGYAMVPIGEDLHPSVYRIVDDKAAKDQGYSPPNLVEYARRENPSLADDLARRCRHVWPAAPWGAWLWLVVWASVVAGGFAALFPLLGFTGHTKMILWLAPLVAAFAVAVDWWESLAVHRLALSPTNGRRQALVSVLYWVRFFCFGLFVVGVPFALGFLGDQLWRCLDVSHWLGALSFENVADRLQQIFRGPWDDKGIFSAQPCAFYAAAVTALVLRLFGAARPPALPRGVAKFSWSAVLVFAVTVATVIVGLFGMKSVVVLLTGMTDLPALQFSEATVAERDAGALLLAMLAWMGLLHSYHNWIGEPLRRRNLGSIFNLQRRFTPDGVHEQLSDWSKRLCQNPKDDASAPALRMKDSLRETLWRDALGFVPLYTLVFVAGLWYANVFLHWNCPVTRHWVAFPLVIALLDQIENSLHAFKYLPAFLSNVVWKNAGEDRRIEGGRPGRVWVLFGFTVSMLKTAGFLVAAVYIWCAIVCGGGKILVQPDGGWRAALAVAVWAALVIGSLTQFAIWFRALIRWPENKAEEGVVQE